VLSGIVVQCAQLAISDVETVAVSLGFKVFCQEMAKMPMGGELNGIESV